MVSINFATSPASIIKGNLEKAAYQSRGWWNDLNPHIGQTYTSINTKELSVSLVLLHSRQLLEAVGFSGIATVTANRYPNFDILCCNV